MKNFLKNLKKYSTKSNPKIRWVQLVLSHLHPITFKCLIETIIHHASTYVHKFINLSKYSYISIHDDHGSMMMYDIHMHLDSCNTIISDDSRYIVSTFNINTQKTIHIVCVYKVHSCSIFIFLNNLQPIIQQSVEYCPIIIMGYFNVEILKDNNQAKKKQELLYFMDKFQLKSQFSENTTKAWSQWSYMGKCL